MILRDIGSRVRLPPGLVAFAFYLVSLAVVLGRPMLLHPRHACLCNGDSDPAITMWSLRWWPWAIAHATNPFVAHVIVPGFDTAAGTTIPTASLLLAPITLTLGPIFAYNVLALAGPPLGGYTAFRLTRRLTGATAPSVAAGYLYAFATTVVAHLTSLPHVYLAFLFPLMAELVVVRAAGGIGRRGFVAALALVLVLQLGVSTEMLFHAVVAGAIVLVAVLLAERTTRARVRALVGEIVLAGVVAVVVASPFLYYALTGPFPPKRADLPNGGALDALNPVVPTAVTRIGRHYFGGVAHRFQLGNVTEASGYMGIVLLLAYATFTIAAWRRLTARVLFYAFAAGLVMALGAHLTITGIRTIPMPYDVVSGLPLFSRAVPSRVVVFAQLALAVGMGVWLAQRGGRPWIRWGAVLVGAAMLFPNSALPNWRGRERVPALFREGLYRRYIPKGSTVLALPFAYQDNATLWQAETGMYFKLSDAYLRFPPKSYSSGKDLELDAAVGQLLNPVTVTRAGFGHYLRSRRVDVIVLDAGKPSGYNVPPGAGAVWRFALHRLGFRSVPAGGVLLYHVPQHRRKGSTITNS